MDPMSAITLVAAVVTIISGVGGIVLYSRKVGLVKSKLGVTFISLSVMVAIVAGTTFLMRGGLTRGGYASAPSIQATSTSIQYTATATLSNADELYQQVTNQQAALNDPLSAQNQDNWDTGSSQYFGT